MYIHKLCAFANKANTNKQNQRHFKNFNEVFLVISVHEILTTCKKRLTKVHSRFRSFYSINELRTESEFKSFLISTEDKKEKNTKKKRPNGSNATRLNLISFATDPLSIATPNYVLTYMKGGFRHKSSVLTKCIIALAHMNINIFIGN